MFIVNYIIPLFYFLYLLFYLLRFCSRMSPLILTLSWTLALSFLSGTLSPCSYGDQITGDPRILTDLGFSSFFHFFYPVTPPTSKSRIGIRLCTGLHCLHLVNVICRCNTFRPLPGLTRPYLILNQCPPRTHKALPYLKPVPYKD